MGLTRTLRTRLYRRVSWRPPPFASMEIANRGLQSGARHQNAAFLHGPIFGLVLTA
jgi:hypothetical protein